jgi:hypothetical protein
MKVLSNSLRGEWFAPGWLRLLLLACAASLAVPAAANVFASQLRLNGASTNLQTTAGQSVGIAYRLNQAADAGVTVSVCIGTNVAWSTNIAGGAPGTLKGTNGLTWPGVDAVGNPVTNGNWSVCVWARASGFGSWTEINSGYVYSSQGIAVNNNTNSLHFGRIFIGNAVQGTGSDPGDAIGFTKYYADGSYAAEGAFSTGGFAWSGNDVTPWKIEVGQDDRVYVADGASTCSVLSFDQFITTNATPLQVLRTNNMANPGVNYAGLFVAPTGTNQQLYMTDIGAGGPGGVGVRRWDVTASGTVATNDPGISVVPASVSLPLDLFPQDVSLDANGRIFVIQKLGETDAQTNRILAYPPYAGTPLTAPLWTVTNTALVNAFGIAAALHTNFVAVASRGSTTHGITLYNTDSGAAIATPGLNTGSSQYTDVSWDRAGNLYVADWLNSVWSVFSPPGTNRYQTISVQTIKVGAFTRPTLLAPSWMAGQFQATLVGELGVNYAMETSTNLVAWSSFATNRAYSKTNTWTWPLPDARASVRARVIP